MFVFAGLTQNNLPLVNRRINHDLRLNLHAQGGLYVPNHGLVSKVVEQNFLVDMNRGIDFGIYRDTVVRFHRLVPDELRNTHLADSLDSLIQEFEAKKTGLDLAVLAYKFFTAAVATKLPMETYAAHTKELGPESRLEVLERLNEAVQCICAASDSLNPDLNSASAIAQAEKALQQYHDTKPQIPDHLIERPQSPLALELLQLLHQSQNYQLKNLDSFVFLLSRSVHLAPEPTLVGLVLAIGDPASLTGLSVRELLAVFQQHPDDQLSSVVNEVLRFYYQQSPRSNESVIWQEVILLNNLDVYNMVVEHSGTSGHMLSLM